MFVIKKSVRSFVGRLFLHLHCKEVLSLGPKGPTPAAGPKDSQAKRSNLAGKIVANKTVIGYFILFDMRNSEYDSTRLAGELVFAEIYHFVF